MRSSTFDLGPEAHLAESTTYGRGFGWVAIDESQGGPLPVDHEVPVRSGAKK
jgi:hypothetical protein